MTYILLVQSGSPGILCLICGKTSYNHTDIEQKYCGFCHHFHEDKREIIAPERPRA